MQCLVRGEALRYVLATRQHAHDVTGHEVQEAERTLDLAPLHQLGITSD